jgi:hypothetical protein
MSIAQTARVLKAAMDDQSERIRADVIPLAELVMRAVTTHETCARLEASASDDAWNYWDRQAADARDALYERLAGLGITRAMASKLGAVL